MVPIRELKTHSILLADDMALVREGLAAICQGQPQYRVVGQCSEGAVALRMIETQKPDIAVLDLNLPGLSGFEALRRLRLAAPDTPILVFSMHSEPIYADRALEGGAMGYVSKSAPPDELLAAIDALLRGETYVEKDIAREISDGLAQSGDYLRRLTGRDLEILRLLAEGRTLTEIAQSLGVAYKTIANTCTRIREKLGVRSLAELVSVTKGLGLA